MCHLRRTKDNSMFYEYIPIGTYRSFACCFCCTFFSSISSMAATHALRLLFLLLLSVNAPARDHAELVACPRLLFNWLYVFGDSNVDPGNNINAVDPETKYSMKVGLTADFPPYGIDFDKKSTATGRFTNGKTAADFLAFLGGQPLLPQAYTSMLDMDRTSVLDVSGMNYASSGCGILPSTKPPLVDCFNLEKQIDLFNSTVQQDLSSVFEEPEVLGGYLSDAMFFISIGVNDFVFTYPTAPKMDPEKFAFFLIWELTIQIGRLYRIGARRFIVNNIAPLGCLPGMRNKATGWCNEELNEVIIPYNDQLALLLKTNLTREYADAEFFLADSHNLFYQMIGFPQRYGFTNVRDPCCGHDYHGHLACLSGTTPCSNRDEYLFFDGEHISEAGNRVFAQLCINRTICN